MAIDQTHIRLTYCGTAEANALSNLIKQRQAILKESAKESVSAIAIDIFKSLRARTIQARGAKSLGVEETGMYGSYKRTNDSKSAQRCLRIGFSKYSPEVQPKYPVVWKDNPTDKPFQRKVFLITPENERTPYYLVCQNESMAKKIERERVDGRIKLFGGLAKRMLGVAMAKIASETIGSQMFSGKVPHERQGDLTIDKTGESRGAFNIKYLSGLTYSIDALKNRASDVSNSLKSALNKIAGRLAQAVKNKGFSDKITIPFPEVRK